MGSSQTFYRLYGIFMLVLIFVLVTLRTIPSWKPLNLSSWASASVHDASNSTIDIPTNGIADTTVPKPEPEGPQFELVLSHYDADYARIKQWTNHVRRAPYVQKLGMKLTIYTKNPAADLNDLKKQTGANEVYQLPNVGREGQTILHHIIHKHASPSKFTMFSQDEPEWTLKEDGSLIDWYHRKFWSDFRPNTGFLGLNEWNEPCVCGDCGGRGQFPLQVAIYNMFEHDVCHGTNWNNLWSQFIISRERLQSRPLDSFKWLEKMISAPKDHWIHAETQPDFIKNQYMPGGSTPSNPLFGHTVERSWALIFQCSILEKGFIEAGLGFVDEHNVHCWDWKEGGEGQEELDGKGNAKNWPGFEDVDKEVAYEEDGQRKEEEKLRGEEMRLEEERRKELEDKNKQREVEKLQKQKELQEEFDRQTEDTVGAVEDWEDLSKVGTGDDADYEEEDERTNMNNKGLRDYSGS